MQTTFRSHDLVWRPVAVEEHRSLPGGHHASRPAVPARSALTSTGRPHAFAQRATLVGVATIVLVPLMAVVIPVPQQFKKAAPSATPTPPAPNSSSALPKTTSSVEDDRYSAGPNLCRVPPASRTGAISHDPRTTSSQRGTGPSISAFQRGARCRSAPLAAPACGTERLEGATGG